MENFQTLLSLFKNTEISLLNISKKEKTQIFFSYLFENVFMAKPWVLKLNLQILTFGWNNTISNEIFLTTLNTIGDIKALNTIEVKQKSYRMMQKNSLSFL